MKKDRSCFDYVFSSQWLQSKEYEESNPEANLTNFKEWLDKHGHNFSTKEIEFCLRQLGDWWHTIHQNYIKQHLKDRLIKMWIE